jgi:phage-related protein (TIGR01555 family)
MGFTDSGGPPFKKQGSSDLNRVDVESLDEELLGEIYDKRGIGGVAVDKIVGNMIRPWFQLEDETLQAAFKADSARLNLKQTLSTALTYNEVYGGSVIVVGVNQGNLAAPLNHKAQSKIEYLQLYKPSNVYAIQKDDFNNPESFEINKSDGEKIIVHASRVLWFKGRTKLSGESGFFGSSIYQRIIEDLENLRGANESVYKALKRFAVSVLKLSKMGEISTNKEGKQKLQNMLSSISMYRDEENIIALDSEDDFASQTLNLGNLDKILAEFRLSLTAVTEVPESILFGTMAGGLSQNKKADFKQFYDLIDWKRDTQLEKPVQKLLRIMMVAEDVQFTFGALEKEDVELKSKVLKSDVEAYEKLLEMGVVSGEEVREKLGFEVE